MFKILNFYYSIKHRWKTLKILRDMYHTKVYKCVKVSSILVNSSMSYDKKYN